VRFTLPNSQRLGEGDQYGTSKAVAKESIDRGLPSNMVYVANGARPMDAALLGAVVGRATGIMVLSPGPANTTAASTAAVAGLKGIDRLVLVNGSAPSPAAPAADPTPAAVSPPPAAVSPPPPAVVTPARRKGRLSSTVTPASDLRAPYVFRTSGKLTLPSGVTKAVGCSGRVSVQIKRGGTTISTRRVSLSKTCTYSSRVSFAVRKRFGSATRLRFIVRFAGNARVSPSGAASRYARVRLPITRSTK
jgi:hypothetical protein